MELRGSKGKSPQHRGKQIVKESKQSIKISRELGSMTVFPTHIALRGQEVATWESQPGSRSLGVAAWESRGGMGVAAWETQIGTGSV